MSDNAQDPVGRCFTWKRKYLKIHQTIQLQKQQCKKRNKAPGKRVIEIVLFLSQATVWCFSWEREFIIGKCDREIRASFQIHDWYSGNCNELVYKDFKIT